MAKELTKYEQDLPLKDYIESTYCLPLSEKELNPIWYLCGISTCSDRRRRVRVTRSFQSKDRTSPPAQGQLTTFD